MSKYAIRAEKLGKEYAISQVTNRFPTLKDFVSRALRAPLERVRNVLRGRGARSFQESFWALRDVSFEVAPGTVVGLIGRNGSGKSTLLKILSRITDPNEGWAELHGRVGSLLEVGTGFHAELSGRDNIFLNGAMLGMSRREIRRHFDDIINFAEIEKFLDTPVKHYSSGMYARLAFAVAAHLDPEILFVDEVLAVGDPSFQKKCLDKMASVSRNGRTVLIVSHALPIIQNKCHSVLWLERGQLRRAGKTDDILPEYVKTLAALENTALEQRADREGTGMLRFLRVEFQDARGQTVPSLIAGEPVAIVLHIANDTNKDLHNAYFHFTIDDSANGRVSVLMNQVLDQAADVVCRGVCSVTFKVPRWPLAPGRYSYSLACQVNGALADSVQNAGAFHVEAGDFYRSGKAIAPGHGIVLLDYAFEMGQPQSCRPAA